MQKRFPEVGKKLEAALRAFGIGQKSLEPVLSKVATKLNVRINTVNSWRKGVRCIPKEQIEPLIRVLGHKTENGDLTPEGIRLVNELTSARKNDELMLSWKERAEKQDIELRVAQARYRGAGRFWGRIFFPFLDAANIRHAKDHGDRNFHELQQAVWKGDLDVALGILATPRLSLKLWFFNSPIRYRLNCVALAGGGILRDMARVRDVLAHTKLRIGTFAPIIMRGEVGEAYARNNLGLVNPILVKSFSAESFCDALLNASGAGVRIPLVIVDEITCLSVLIKLKGRGKLVFPLMPHLNDSRALIPPSFPLGLCVSRNELVGHAKKSELMAFIRDALTTYIEGNAQSIAFSYLALRNHIRRLADLAIPDFPAAEREEWMAHTFGLHRQTLGLEPPHWRAVLEEAAAISLRERRTL